MTPKGYTAYQRTEVKTADRRKIIVLLYESAISRLTQAKQAMGRGDTDTRTAGVKKALDIIHFLSNGLDHKRGGEIAFNLSRLYDYCRDIISLGNIESDPKKFDEAIGLLRPLLEAWQEIAKGADPTNPGLAVAEKAKELSERVAQVG
jgi:flagellar protein FliS